MPVTTGAPAPPTTTSSSAATVERGWDPILVCLAAFILTSVGRVHQLFPVLLPLKLAIVTGGLAILLWLLDRSSARRLAAFRLPATRYLLALTAWMALSIPGALWPGGAFHTSVNFAKTAAIFVILVSAVRSVRDVERLAWAYFLAAVVFALVVLTRFDLSEEWRLADLYYYDANDFATLIVTALPLGLYFAFAGRRRLLRGVAWGGIAALVVGFIWSGSRGGFLALLVVVVYVLLRYSTIAKRWRLAAVAVIGLVAAGTASDRYWDNIGTLLRPAEDYNLTGEEGRLRIWQRGIGYMIRRPVLGVGAGQFPTAEGTMSPLAGRRPTGRGIKWAAPHNSYLQVGAELGVPGLVIFAGFLVSVFAGLRGPKQVGRRRAARPRLAQALTAALVGFAVGAFFLTLAYHEMLYTLAGLAVALHKVSPDTGASPDDALHQLSQREWRSIR